MSEETTRSPGSQNQLLLGGTSDSETAGPLQSIHFDYKKEYPLQADQRALQANVEFLKANPQVKVTVEGHCDPIGGLAYNERLGKKRAQYVLNYLLENGVTPDRLKLVSMSSRVPLSDPADDSALKKQKDRRVNFVIDAF